MRQGCVCEHVASPEDPSWLRRSEAGWLHAALGGAVHRDAGGPPGGHHMVGVGEPCTGMAIKARASDLLSFFDRRRGWIEMVVLCLRVKSLESQSQDFRYGRFVVVETWQHRMILDLGIDASRSKLLIFDGRSYISSFES